MRSFLIIISAFLSVTLSYAAELDARGAVGAMQKKIESYGSYTASIRIRAKGAAASVSANYSVSGELYYMEMSRYEIFGEGRTRYEVNNKNREIIVVKSDGEDNTLLSNPAQSLKSLWHDFDAQLISTTAKEWRILLTPKSSLSGAISSVTLDIDRTTSLPVRLVYEAEDDRVIIRFDGIKDLSKPIPRFDESRFEGYEIIDF